MNKTLHLMKALLFQSARNLNNLERFKIKTIEFIVKMCVFFPELYCQMMALSHFEI